ncbi:gdsl esterase/lipase [Quercus suber]|uniref:Gdsl esterase/lipase n=1 Tax=Quercus suber TaxID=58331 RepID=A0AAW0IS62_QUESU
MLTLTIVLVVIVAPNKAEAARAFFVFGDSLVDSGNNNYLATTARADSPPNGIDYPTHRPTGRFSNGFNLPDIISEFIVLISISLHISLLSLTKFSCTNVFH